MRDLWIDAEHTLRVTLPDGVIANVNFSVRQAGKDGGPFGRDLDTSFFDQALQIVEFGPALMGFHKVRDEVFILHQKTKLRRLLGQFDRLAEDVIAAGQALFASAAPEKVE